MKFIAAFALLGLAAAPVFAQSDDPLAAAKNLYSSASYQEALAVLDTVRDGAALDQADKYRALCLLALNRPDDAEHTVERLLERQPLFKIDPGDSPKLVAVFTATRARVLPAAATSLYDAAKAAMGQGDTRKAAEMFGKVATLLSEPEFADQRSLADLKVLADGFAKLTNEQLALERRAAAAEEAPKQAAAAATTPDPDHVYSDQDSGVVVPAPISEVFPVWQPPNDSFRRFTYSGELELIIDERGAVTTARMLKRIFGGYESALLDAAKNWRYRPATKNGKPVKYRKLIRVNLLPGSPAGVPPTSDLQLQ